MLANDYIQENFIKCMATNYESLISKYDELKVRVHELKPDILFGTETWLKTDTNDSFIDIPGFYQFRVDTTEVRGGVNIYVREHLNVTLCKELDKVKLKDTLWLWLKNTGKPDSLLGVIYRKGASSQECNSKLLEQFDMANKICNGNILVYGDFNLPLIVGNTVLSTIQTLHFPRPFTTK